MALEVIFEIDVITPNLLEDEINRYNQLHHTDFTIVNVHEEIELFFCSVKTTASIKDIFSLGYGFACYEEELRKQGKIDW